MLLGVSARHAARGRINLRPLVARHSLLYSTSTPSPAIIKTVRLAFDLHQPPLAEPKQTEARHLPPILFLHGLFGSKANNRSVSK